MVTVKGSTAIVTGAGSGIGRGLALKAAREGMNVAIADVTPGPLAETEAMIRKLGAPVFAAAVDVTDRKAMTDFAAKTEAALAPLALIFPNAGILRQGPILSYSVEDWRRLYEVNVIGVVNTLTAFVPQLRARKVPTHIVITGSQASFVAYPGLCAYGSTKHALWAIADGLRADFEAEGAQIGISLLAPGPIATAIFDATEVPPGPRPVAMTPDELADIVFLGIRNGDRVISTHATLNELAEARFADTLAEIKKGPRPH